MNLVMVRCPFGEKRFGELQLPKARALCMHDKKDDVDRDNDMNHDNDNDNDNDSNNYHKYNQIIKHFFHTKI